MVLVPFWRTLRSSGVGWRISLGAVVEVDETSGVVVGGAVAGCVLTNAATGIVISPCASPEKKKSPAGLAAGGACSCGLTSGDRDAGDRAAIRGFLGGSFGSGGNHIALGLGDAIHHLEDFGADLDAEFAASTGTGIYGCFHVLLFLSGVVGYVGKTYSALYFSMILM